MTEPSFPRRVSILGSAALLCLAVGSPALAVETAKTALLAMRRHPMEVRIVQPPGCKEACAQWIAAEGHIEPGSAAAFGRVLRALGDRRLPIFIDSGGGAVDEAMAIGRLIRAKKLDVVVTKTLLEPCTGRTCRSSALAVARAEPVASICASACVLVLAAGVQRTAQPWTGVGVHEMSATQTRIWRQPTYRVFYREVDGVRVEVSRELISQRIIATDHRTVKAEKPIYDRVARYLAEMGVGKGLIPLMLATPPSGIHWLTAQEERATAIVTDTGGGLTSRAAPASLPTGARIEAFTADLDYWRSAPAAARLEPTPEPVPDGREHAVLDIFGAGGAGPRVGLGQVTWTRDAAGGPGLTAQVDVAELAFTLTMRLAPAPSGTTDGTMDATIRIAGDPLRRVTALSDMAVLSERPALVASKIPFAVRESAADTFAIRFAEPTTALADHLLATRRPWIVLHLTMDGNRTAALRFEHVASTPLIRQAFAQWAHDTTTLAAAPAAAKAPADPQRGSP